MTQQMTMASGADRLTYIRRQLRSLFSLAPQGKRAILSVARPLSTVPSVSLEGALRDPQAGLAKQHALYYAALVASQATIHYHRHHWRSLGSRFPEAVQVDLVVNYPGDRYRCRLTGAVTLRDRGQEIRVAVDH